jgi:hypothetical protein
VDRWTFGITMLVVGIGGTLVTLAICSVVMEILKRLFPYKDEQK